MNAYQDYQKQLKQRQTQIEELQAQLQDLIAQMTLLQQHAPNTDSIEVEIYTREIEELDEQNQELKVKIEQYE